MQSSNDTISCGCGNKFKVFKKATKWRITKCKKCSRRWWVTFSGRRLREFRNGDERFVTSEVKNV